MVADVRVVVGSSPDLNASAELPGQREDDAFRAVAAAERVLVLALHHLADEVRSLRVEAGKVFVEVVALVDVSGGDGT